ncbi:MAG: CotH kinase family protein, partial [Bacteroidetes bacterium]|nr:CotH kinase family protein [Bacteroidota bacterium]
MLNIIKLILISFLTLNSVASFAQSLYDVQTIQTIDIYFSQSDWDKQLDSIKYTTDGYLKADSISINGKTYNEIGVKYKGNSSYDSTFKKNPFTISLDKYKSHSYQGYTSLKLSNCYQDPSMVREVLAYNILSNYMVCPKANFARVTVNGVYIGLYSNIEDITKSWCASQFQSNKSNTFIKCNPIITPGPNVKSNLKYISADSNDYTNYYELKSNAGMQELIDLCSTATYLPSNLSKMMDMDRLAWMLAFNNLFVNLDSYSGAFSQNYFIFKDNNGIFNPIIWDLNMCFGGFPFAGNLNSSLGSLSVTNMKQFPITIHETDPYWPLINAFMSNPVLKRKYVAHMKTMLNEMVMSNTYSTLENSLKTLVDSSVTNDANKFYTNAQYLASINTDIQSGSYYVPAISNLMSARATYLQGLSDFTSTSPNIQGISAASGSTLDSSNITTYITDAKNVYLGSRLSNDKKFDMIEMFDDGNHNDGVAGDHIYGATISYNISTTELYIYAENDQAGSFSPPRAEYEFHSLKQIVGMQNQSELSAKLNIYPNPCATVLNIESDMTTLQNLELSDLSGKVLVKSSFRGSTQVETSNLSQGVYFLRIGNTV